MEESFGVKQSFIDKLTSLEDRVEEYNSIISTGEHKGGLSSKKSNGVMSYEYSTANQEKTRMKAIMEKMLPDLTLVSVNLNMRENLSMDELMEMKELEPVDLRTLTGGQDDQRYAYAVSRLGETHIGSDFTYPQLVYAVICAVRTRWKEEYRPIVEHFYSYLNEFEEDPVRLTGDGTIRHAWTRNPFRIIGFDLVAGYRITLFLNTMVVMLQEHISVIALQELYMILFENPTVNAKRLKSAVGSYKDAAFATWSTQLFFNVRTSEMWNTKYADPTSETTAMDMVAGFKELGLFAVADELMKHEIGGFNAESMKVYQVIIDSPSLIGFMRSSTAQVLREVPDAPTNPEESTSGKKIQDITYRTMESVTDVYKTLTPEVLQRNILTSLTNKGSGGASISFKLGERQFVATEKTIVYFGLYERYRNANSGRLLYTEEYPGMVGTRDVVGGKSRRLIYVTRLGDFVMQIIDLPWIDRQLFKDEKEFSSSDWSVLKDFSNGAALTVGSEVGNPYVDHEKMMYATCDPMMRCLGADYSSFDISETLEKSLRYQLQGKMQWCLDHWEIAGRVMLYGGGMSAKGYDIGEEVYASDHGLNLSVEVDAKEVQSLLVGNVLDIGSGTGEYHEGREYNLVTVDPNVVCNRSDKHYSTVDQVQGKYDVILLRHAWHHIKDRSHLHDKLGELVADNGIIIIIDQFDAGDYEYSAKRIHEQYLFNENRRSEILYFDRPNVIIDQSVSRGLRVKKFEQSAKESRTFTLVLEKGEVADLPFTTAIEGSTVKESYINLAKHARAGDVFERINGIYASKGKKPFGSVLRDFLLGMIMERRVLDKKGAREFFDKYCYRLDGDMTMCEMLIRADTNTYFQTYVHETAYEKVVKTTNFLPSGKIPTLATNNIVNGGNQYAFYERLDPIVQRDFNFSITRAMQMLRLHGDDSESIFVVPKGIQEIPLKKTILGTLHDVSAEDGLEINVAKQLYRSNNAEYLKVRAINGFLVPRVLSVTLSKERAKPSLHPIIKGRIAMDKARLYVERGHNNEIVMDVFMTLVAVSLFVTEEEAFRTKRRLGKGVEYQSRVVRKIYLPIMTMFVPRSWNGVGLLPWGCVLPNQDLVVYILANHFGYLEQLRNVATLVVISTEFKERVAKDVKSVFAKTRLALSSTLVPAKRVKAETAVTLFPEIRRLFPNLSYSSSVGRLIKDTLVGNPKRVKIDQSNSTFQFLLLSKGSRQAVDTSNFEWAKKLRLWQRPLGPEVEDPRIAMRIDMDAKLLSFQYWHRFEKEGVNAGFAKTLNRIQKILRRSGAPRDLRVEGVMEALYHPEVIRAEDTSELQVRILEYFGLDTKAANEIVATITDDEFFRDVYSGLSVINGLTNMHVRNFDDELLVASMKPVQNIIDVIHLGMNYCLSMAGFNNYTYVIPAKAGAKAFSWLGLSLSVYPKKVYSKTVFGARKSMGGMQYVS
jgi:hypothetical protein